MDEVSFKVVSAAHDFIKRLLDQGLLKGDALTEAHMASTALGYDLARNRYGAERLQKVRQAEHALCASLQEAPGALAAAAAFERSAGDAWRAGVGANLTAAIESIDAAVASDKAFVRRVRAFLVDYHEPMDPAISGGTQVTYSGGRGDKGGDADDVETVHIDKSSLQDYLRHRFPGQSTEVLSVDRLMGGYSKQTYIVKLAENGAEKTIVLRKDGYGLPTGSSVTAEFPILQEVHALGAPAPKPLWIEPDSKWFETAFMAVDHVVAEPANHVIPADAQTRARWAAEIAAVLAHLHRVTVRPEADVCAVLRSDIADLRKRVQARERLPHPGLSLGLAWLEAHVEQLSGRPACRVHGDFGFHNMLMRDARLVGLLDWEFSHIGDPLEDLQMFRPFMERFQCWEHFLNVYQERCDYRYDPAYAQFFAVWVEVRNMVACLGSLNSLLLPKVKDVALSVAGTIYIPKYEVGVLDAVLGGA